MEEIAITNKQVSTELLSNVSRALYPINNFLQFPLTDTQLEDWSKFILDQEPEFDSRYLNVIFNYFITGKYRVDGRLTVMDIFECYISVLYDLIKTRRDLSKNVIMHAYKYRNLLMNKTKGADGHNWASMKIMEIELEYERIKNE